jgi:hypothetical protein
MRSKTYSTHDQAKTSRKLVEELLTQGDQVVFAASGPSMTPVIQSGEKVLVAPIHSHRIMRGSIILFKKHNRLILHRFIRYEKNGRLRIAADAALQGIENVPQEHVIGIAMEKAMLEKQSIKRLNHSVSRWGGILRYYLRPLRRCIDFLRKKS